MEYIFANNDDPMEDDVDEIIEGDPLDPDEEDEDEDEDEDF